MFWVLTVEYGGAGCVIWLHKEVCRNWKMMMEANLKPAYLPQFVSALGNNLSPVSSTILRIHLRCVRFQLKILLAESLFFIFISNVKETFGIKVEWSLLSC